MNETAPYALSDRFKFSFKLALAIVMAYGFALWFNWDKPMWAVFGVTLISMTTLGESLGKGGLRLQGTLLAVPVSLGLIALFPQDRWLFMMSLAAWLAFCTYRMSSGRSAYLWFCAGFVTAIITSDGGPDPVNAFTLAAIRTLETTLGIVCYALVFSLLWPVKSVDMEPATPSAAITKQAFPDPDRLQQAMRVFITYCAGFLLVIYVPGFPGGFGFLAMLAPFSILLANQPHIPARMLLKPVIASMLLAVPIYMVLPLLEGFIQLALVIFITIFLICYFLHQPQQQLGRTFGIAFFAVVTGISNEQGYSFLAVANTALMFGLVLLLLTITASLPVSNQPEKAFVRLIQRFLRSASFLAKSSDPVSNPLGRYIRAYHRYEIQSIPGKLSTWRDRIPAEIAAPRSADIDALLEHVATASEELLRGTGQPVETSLETLKASYATMDLSTFMQARF